MAIIPLNIVSTTSRLLHIPPELRLMIFERLFRSVTARHGFEKSSIKHSSILLTNKQIHREAEPILAPNLLFHFRSTEKMVGHLMTLTPEQIRSIRYIRVKAFPSPLYPDTDFGMYVEERPPSQPAGWNRDVQDLDGVDSGASVVMYTPSDPAIPGSMSNQKSHEIHVAAPESGSAQPIYQRGALIVARRGTNSKYTQDGSQLDPLIKNLLRQMTWQEIKEEGLLLEAEDDPCRHL
ncbi:MAG: hypothetical protein M1812_005521 [Candelaria pacifica]|nr:MAG: hypothetical protein M1812_005521 [Candelaria pacifica]